MSTVPCDTTPDIAARVTARLRAMTGADRLLLAMRMFTTARRLAESRARARGIPEGPALKLAVVRHLYGDDLTAQQYEALHARYRHRG